MIETLTAQQIVESAQAGAAFLDKETTLIPGNVKKQLIVLEVILAGIGQGQLQVVPTPLPTVELDPEPTADGGENAEPHRERETQESGHDTSPETGRAPTGDTDDNG